MVSFWKWPGIRVSDSGDGGIASARVILADESANKDDGGCVWCGVREAGTSVGSVFLQVLLMDGLPC